MKKYLPYVGKYWYSFILAPFFMILEACGEFILPYINANIIDVGAANRDLPYILKNGLLMLAVAVCMLITGVLGANFAVRGAARLAAGLRRDAFAKIQDFSFSNIDDFSAGSLITRITNDITQIQNFAQSLLRGMFRSPVMIIGALVMSFVLNPSLAKVFLVIVPLLALAITVIICTASPRYGRMQRALDELNGHIGETITNERVIKSFVREDFAKEKFGRINEKLVEKSTSALKMMLLLQPVSALVMNAATLIVVWAAGKQIMVGDMELGILTSFIIYLTQMLTALNFLANIVLQGARAATSDRRISQVLETETDIGDTGAAYANRQVKHGSIELRDVSFRYFKGSREKILDSVSLKIHAGELVGIIGSTGSGKTTLVSLIPRLYDADEGEVLVDGMDVRQMPLRHLRESIAMVLQNNILFSGTIRENLRWGNEEATEEEIKEAAEAAQADAFVSALPNGYDTELGQGGVNLSGGQKQRLCIARALLKRPRILILDDSTSAVDMATDASIRRALRERLPGVTKLIIAQRINSVMDADKIVVMDEGRIVGCADHATLSKECRQYQEIYWSQKDREEKAEK